MVTRWAILTGEYPPQPGGVSDYARLVAAGLAEGGDRVAVYAPPADGPPPADPGVTVRRLPDRFGPRGLAALDRALHAAPRPDRILVQYVPHAYGWKGMNLPFAAWVSARARRIAPVDAVFHEVAFPLVRRPLRHAALGAVNRLMARWVGHAAARSFVSIPAWVPLLRRVAPRSPAPEWLPIPSNLTGHASAEGVAAARRRHAPPEGGLLVGHFGTYGDFIAGLLLKTLPRLLAADPARAVLLLGRGSERFRGELIGRHPALAGRVRASGEREPDDLIAHLKACDWLYQPFVDGLSSRRTSLMAGLANGLPVASNLGPLSEPIWERLACVALAPSPAPDALVAAADEAFRRPPEARDSLGRRAAAAYAETFALGRTIAALRSFPPPRPVRPVPEPPCRPAACSPSASRTSSP